MVGNISTANVSNITSIGNTVKGYRYIGGVTGGITSGSASNINSSENTVQSTTSYTGGVVGQMEGGTLDSVTSTANTVQSTTSYTGGVVGVMASATIINAVSKDNMCTVGTVTCGGVVGLCTSADGKILNVLSDGNTVESTTHANTLYLGLILGCHKDYRLAYKVANTLTLTGTAEYVFDKTVDTAKKFAAGVGIVMGDGVNALVESSYYFVDYRTKYDVLFSSAAGTDYSTTSGLRLARGVLQNSGTSNSRGGTDAGFIVHDETQLTNNTTLNLLNDWVTNNKETYPSLKSWVVSTSDKTFPDLIVMDTATPSAEPLNVVESQY